jgi:DNA mismatch repair protein MutL
VGRIRRLPEHIINKIAAGEVVERPASVVKELVENALDADAAAVAVDLRDGGAVAIRVVDDGVGMSPAELELALERHATSKIATEADLSAVVTLGFRGEALPAICAVSRFAIVTCPRPSRDGIRVTGQGGAVSQRMAVPASPGTTVEVNDLFFNTPARLKFLKSPATELAASLRLLTPLAFAHPRVRVAVTNNGRPVLTAAAATSLADRAGAILGWEQAERLLPVESRDHGIGVTGLISPPSVARGSRDAIVTIVNGRPVRDPALLAAVLEAFRPLLPRDRFPIAVIALDVPAADVDVNVHPTKAWVRFRSPRLVQEMVVVAVQAALRRREVVTGTRATPATTAVVGLAEAGVGGGGAEVGAEQAVLFAEEAAPYARPLFGRVLGQVQDTFVVTASDEEVFFIDQHVAHERVLYERLQAEVAGGLLASQELLVAQPVGLGPAARALLDRWQPVLRRLGFVVEEFGDDVALRAVPAMLAGQEPRTLVEGLLDDLRPAGSEAPEIARALAFVSCRAAIKAGQPLAPEEMARLASDLGQTASPFFCPHGRPIVSRVSLGEIRKELRRSW